MRRLLEATPGILSWALLLLPMYLSFYFPEHVSIFITLFSLLWVLRSMGFALHLIGSYFFFRTEERIQWATLLTKLQTNEVLTSKEETIFNKVKNAIPAKTIDKNNPLKLDEIIHIVIVATYKEPLEVLVDTVNSITATHFDLKRVVFILAIEERDKERGHANGVALEAQFGALFRSFHVFEHPKDIPGEVAGKGGNISFALGSYVKEMQANGTLLTIEDQEKYVITTLDADNKVHKEYFNVLSLYYQLAPSRISFSYQPLPFLCNNIWQVPIFNRMVAISSTFWHLVESGRPHRLRNFSSHAQPLAALIDMNYWSTESIVEDGHQFWRSYFHFKGDYAVIPIFIPIYQDAVEQEKYMPTIMAQYKQLRRWAFGAEDFAFAVIEWWKKRKEMPFLQTFSHIGLLLEGHIMWASAPIVLMLSTKGPMGFNPDFMQTNFYFHLGHVLGIIFNLSFMGIIVSMWIWFLLLPPFPKNISKKRRFYLQVSQIFQWALLPITTIVFAALPALETQTRLILGNKLGFNVTEKIRKKV